jgi:hypothetical protein
MFGLPLGVFAAIATTACVVILIGLGELAVAVETIEEIERDSLYDVDDIAALMGDQPFYVPTEWERETEV